MIPDKNDSLELLKRSGCNKRVIRHCQVVAKLAASIGEAIKEKGYQVDLELVYSGALVHDIGRGMTHGLDHGVEGVRMAEDAGLDRRIINIIMTHIGAGISEDDAAEAGLPPGNYMPQTLEEKIVAHADNLVVDNKILTISEVVEILKKKGRHKRIIDNIIKLNDEISALYVKGYQDRS